jgi:uncharacterized membrane protein
MDAFIHFLYHQCGYLCHQLSDRTWVLDDRAMPLCARCTGIYIGALLGSAWLAIQAGVRGRFVLDRGYTLFLAFSSVYFFFDVLAGSCPQTAWSRTASGLVFGFAVMSALWSFINKNFLKAERQLTRQFSKADVLAVMMGLSLTLLFIMLLPQSTLVYYLFLVSEVIGVIIIYGCANAAMLLVVFDKSINRGYPYRHVGILFVSGLICFVLEMATINFFSKI